MRRAICTLILSLFVLAVPASGQQGFGAQIYSGGAWIAAPSSSISNPTINVLPIHLYCYSAGVSAWVPADSSCFGGGGGSGTVSSGTAGQIAFYAANGTTVSGTAGIATDGVNELTVGSSVYATGQGVWHRRGIVMYPDQTVSNPYQLAEPTVIIEGSPLILTAYPTVWKMWYSEGNKFCYSESIDGLVWTRYTAGAGTNGCLKDSFVQPDVIKNGGTYYYFGHNQTSGNLDVFTSTDGVTFTLLQAGIVTGGTNSGGTFQSGTLYLFVETNAGTLHLYTSTSPFTSYADQGLIGPWRGPSPPYFLNNKWWMWVHYDAVPQSTNCGAAGTGCSTIRRLTASSLTGPWSNSEANDDFWPQTTDEMGGNGEYGQTADPYLVEYQGKTYMFYENNQFDGTRNYSQMKVAVADMPLTSVVLTNGGPANGTIDFPPDTTPYSGVDYSFDYKYSGIKNLGLSVAGSFSYTNNATWVAQTNGNANTFPGVQWCGNSSANCFYGYFDYTGSLSTASGSVGHGTNFYGGRNLTGYDSVWWRNYAKNVYAAFINTNYPNGSIALANFTNDHALLLGGFVAYKAGSAIASATTIAPSQQFFHVTGTTAIATITAPASCVYTGTMCQITIIPDGLFTTTTAGNIALASTAVVSKALIMTYDPANSKWYPSY